MTIEIDWSIWSPYMDTSSLPTKIDTSLVPATLDAVHVWLAGVTVVLLIYMFIRWLFRPKKSGPKQIVREAGPDAALQLLGLMQQEARLVDFLNEDLTGYPDADIGATARVVHDGGRKVLNEYFELSPLRNEDEETQVTLPEGFNAAEVRLTGNVVGEAPFTGILVHKGWKINRSNLPKLAPHHDASIIAPAEVEL